MVIKEDCKECVWYRLGFRKPYCKVDKRYLTANEDGSIVPPSDCYYSPNYVRKTKDILINTK